MMVSLDGYYEGPNHEIDWHNADNKEFNDFAIKNVGESDLLLFGRKTYELMATYWPSADALKNDPIVAAQMNNTEKIVFSRTLIKTDWENTRLVKNNAADELRKLKNQEGKAIAILGSSDLALTFISEGLIDEFQIMVNPVVLGAGKPLFDGLKERIQLALVKTKVFNSGNVLLFYK